MGCGDAPALLASGLHLVYSSLQLMDMVPWTVHLCLDIDRELLPWESDGKL